MHTSSLCGVKEPNHCLNIQRPNHLLINRIDLNIKTVSQASFSGIPIYIRIIYLAIIVTPYEQSYSGSCARMSRLTRLI
jgi:hypothetical protein